MLIAGFIALGVCEDILLGNKCKQKIDQLNVVSGRVQYIKLLLWLKIISIFCCVLFDGLSV
jgi:hypothetical protein